MMKRNHMIDIMKGICILIVIFNHYIPPADTVRMNPVFPFFLDLPITAFIIISGYVYSISYERHGITRIHQAYRLDYILDKCLRYTIPFLMIYIPEVILSIRMKADYNRFEYICNFFTGGFGYGSYYYPIMMQFIFVFPIIYFIVKRYDFAGLFICGILNGIFECLQRFYVISGNLYRLLVFRYILLMAFGCYLYVRKSTVKKWIGVVSTLIGGIFIGVTFYGYYTPRILINWTLTSFISVLYVMPAIGMLISSPRCQNFRCKPLAFLGKASYNLFLMQMFFYQFMYYPIYILTEGMSPYILLPLNLAICILCGLLFYLIENRITSFLAKCLRSIHLNTAFHKAVAYINTHFTQQ